jgi:metal-responsive CopG/Arc/MetJ family transcriptional regulator
MRTVQITLDEDLVRTVDRVVRDLHTTRSAFSRDALYRAIESIRTAKLEDKHRQGYLRKPVGAGEFHVWEREQKWGDA